MRRPAGPAPRSRHAPAARRRPGCERAARRPPRTSPGGRRRRAAGVGARPMGAHGVAARTTSAQNQWTPTTWATRSATLQPGQCSTLASSRPRAAAAKPALCSVMAVTQSAWLRDMVATVSTPADLLFTPAGHGSQVCGPLVEADVDVVVPTRHTGEGLHGRPAADPPWRVETREHQGSLDRCRRVPRAAEPLKATSSSSRARMAGSIPEYSHEVIGRWYAGWPATNGHGHRWPLGHRGHHREWPPVATRRPFGDPGPASSARRLTGVRRPGPGRLPSSLATRHTEGGWSQVNSHVT